MGITVPWRNECYQTYYQCELGQRKRLNCGVRLFNGKQEAFHRRQKGTKSFENIVKVIKLEGVTAGSVCNGRYIDPNNGLAISKRLFPTAAYLSYLSRK